MMRLLMICLSSLIVVGCGSAPVDIPSHQTPMYTYSHKFQTCKKFEFLISDQQVGRVGESVKVPLEECDNITGIKNHSEEENDWSDFRAWLENLFDIARDSWISFSAPSVDLDFSEERLP